VAVLTSIDEEDARGILSACDLGALRALQGIAGGSVNSNFALTAGDGRRFFLRLYEERDLPGAERETAMLDRIAKAGVPTPAPLRKSGGGFVSVVKGKAAALFPWREGHMRCQASVTTEDVFRVGEALARVHLAGAKETPEEGRFRVPDLLRRLEYIEKSGDERFVPRVGGLRDALVRTDNGRDRTIPRGLTHGDLFRDNVLWDEAGALTALLDFESACEGTFTYDLMVTVLSWCFSADFDFTLASAMREGYESVRKLGEDERKALFVEGSLGALRFTITRITDYAMRTTAEGPRVIKDWGRFMKRFDRLQELGEAGVRRMVGV
jgi:homoserine kinase type II